MSDTHDDRRKPRRKQTRRMGDMLHDVLTEEERQQFDRLIYGDFLSNDRRSQKRRSYGDRRESGEE